MLAVFTVAVCIFGEEHAVADSLADDSLGVASSLGDYSAGSARFPYRARVVVKRAAVRSGPGEDYYPVMELGSGAEVEVYRHDPGGWYAVRPPEGSYSWVAAAFVEPAPDGSLAAAIRGRRVVVRVGSPLVDVPDVIQLRLNSGDQVRLLDPQPFEFSNMVWYKIAPPAGEFRWISGRELEAIDDARVAPVSGTKAGHTRLSQSQPTRTDEDLTDLTPDGDHSMMEVGTSDASSRAIAADETEDELLAWLARRRQRRRKVLATIERGGPLPEQDAESVDLPASEPSSGANLADVEWALLGVENLDPAPAETSAFAAQPRRRAVRHADYDQPSSLVHNRNEDLAAFDASLEAWLEEEQARARRLQSPHLAHQGDQPLDLAAALEELDLELSAMASEPAENWNLDPLRDRAEQILAKAETSLDRGRARLMLRKLARFEDVQQRYTSLYGKAPHHAHKPRPLELAKTEAPLARADGGTRYDGEGTLTRVVTRAAGAPPYALLDSAGEVKFYVSPAPGVNLRRYEGLRVAVVGSVGYLPEHKAKHITVKQVLPLAAEGVELSAYRQP